MVAEVPDPVFEIAKEKFPTDDETIECYEASIRNSQMSGTTEACAQYYIMIPEGKQGMILLKSQSGVLKHPVVLFDKNKVMIRRNENNCIDLGIVDPTVIKDFTTRKKIFIGEVPENVFEHAKTNPPKETDFTACYEARIYEVSNVDHEKTLNHTTIKSFLNKFSIAIVLLFSIGFGLNQIVPGSNAYQVVSESEEGTQFLLKNKVTCEIKNTVKIYFADIHRGNIQFNLINQQTNTKEPLSEEHVNMYNLKPLFSIWTRFGLLFVIGSMLIIALLFTLLSKNLFYKMMPIAEAIID